MTETAGPVSIAGSKTTYEVRGKREIVFERTYGAAPERVFAAFCDPALVSRWWGSAGAKVEVVAWDVRPGGKWRIRETDATGKRSTFHGEFVEVQSPARIVATFCFGGGIGSALFAFRETYEFAAVEAGTRLRLTSIYPMGAALKGMLSVGMDAPGGYTEGSRHQWRMDRLAALAEA